MLPSLATRFPVDRRQFARREMPIALGIISQPYVDSGGMIVDISGSGMAFRAGRRYRIGERLHLRFRGPTSRFECRMLATVVRINPAARWPLSHLVAVAFD